MSETVLKLQKVRHDVKKYVIISKDISLRQQTHHNLNSSGNHNGGKNPTQRQIQFILRILQHQSDISTMFSARVMCFTH